MPAILFAAAFAAVVLISNRDRVFGTANASAERAAGAPTVLASAPARHAGAMQAPMLRAEHPAPAAITPAAPRKAEPTADQLKVIDELKQQVAIRTEEGGAMEEREARGDAIREIGKLSGPQATQALIAALRNDSDVRNRILAVEGLRRAAAVGDEGGTIREALREASTSADEVIAMHAREAYDALAAR